MQTSTDNPQQVRVPGGMPGEEGRHWLPGRDNHAIEQGRNRLLIAAGLFIMAFGAISVRLVELALPGASSGMAENHAAGATGSVERAEIIDRNGMVIATNIRTASLEASAREVADPQQTVKNLASILPDFDQARALAKLLRGKGHVVLHNDLSPRQQRAINDLGIPGLRFTQDVRRIYPNDNLASHVTGYVDVDNHGLSGIERSQDVRLAQGGEALQLSVDMRVQHALRDEMLRATRRFSAIGAAGLVMDVRTGEVLALASLPDFDPNGKQNNKDDAHFNRVTLGTYEMGSTFKVFNTAMLLDSGISDLDDVYDATNPIRISKFVISDYHGKHRPLSVTEIFLYSSNIGSAKMALAVGPRGQQDFMRKLGMLNKPEIELGELGTPSWPRPWPEISTMTVAYGHGIAVSPLQLGAGVAALVNGGIMVRPSLLRRDASRNIAGARVVSQSTSARMRHLLRMVVANPEGTGNKAEVPGYEIGGKTGTADKPNSGRYSRNTRISSFIAAFPMTRPRYVVLVMLDEPKGIKETFNFATAGWTAAPTAGAVIRRIAPLLGVAPVMIEADGTRLAAITGGQ